MTRNFPILAAVAAVAFLAFAAGDASAMNLGARGNNNPGTPSHESTTPSSSHDTYWDWQKCDIRTHQFRCRPNED